MCSDADEVILFRVESCLTMDTAAAIRTDSHVTPVERRAHARFAAAIPATLHGRGASQATIINDLSAGGAGLSTAIGIFANDRVEIELSDGRRIPGQVAWWIAGSCGVQFDHPLAETDPLLTEVRG